MGVCFHHSCFGCGLFCLPGERNPGTTRSAHAHAAVQCRPRPESRVASAQWSARCDLDCRRAVVSVAGEEAGLVPQLGWGERLYHFILYIPRTAILTQRTQMARGASTLLTSDTCTCEGGASRSQTDTAPDEILNARPDLGRSDSCSSLRQTSRAEHRETRLDSLDNALSPPEAIIPRRLSASLPP